MDGLGLTTQGMLLASHGRQRKGIVESLASDVKSIGPRNTAQELPLSLLTRKN